MLGHSALSELPLSTQPSGSSGGVSVSGQTITVSPTLVSGSVTADANVAGQTITVSPTLVSGTVTADANVGGVILLPVANGTPMGVLALVTTPLSSVSLIDGSVSVAGDVSVSGQTVTVSPTLVSGTVTADANVGGQTVTVTPTLVSGSVSANADVSGQTLTASPVLVDGSVTISGGADANVSGQTLTVTPVLVDGTITTTSAGTQPVTEGGNGGDLWRVYQAILDSEQRPSKRALRRKKGKARTAPVLVEELPPERPLEALQDDLAAERGRIDVLVENVAQIETARIEAEEAERQRIRRKRNNEAVLLLLAA